MKLKNGVAKKISVLAKKWNMSEVDYSNVQAKTVKMNDEEEISID